VIVLDASVMIGVLDRSDLHFPAAKRLLGDAGRERVAAHRLTLAETLVRAAESGIADAVAGALDAMGVGRLDALDDPLELAVLRARTGLRIPDACVLLAAQRVRARLATFDDRLAAAARAEGITVVGQGALDAPIA
jgi:predicted nucleic acid-binding protein